MKYITLAIVTVLLWQHIAPQVEAYYYWTSRVGNICWEGGRSPSNAGERGVFYQFDWVGLELRTYPTCN